MVRLAEVSMPDSLSRGVVALIGTESQGVQLLSILLYAPLRPTRRVFDYERIRAIKSLR